MKLIFIMFTMIPPYLFLLSNLLRQPTIDSLLTICFWHKSAFTSIGGGVVQVENPSTFTSAIQLLPSYIPKISDWASNRRYFQQRAQLMEFFSICFIWSESPWFSGISMFRNLKMICFSNLSIDGYLKMTGSSLVCSYYYNCERHNLFENITFGD